MLRLIALCALLAACGPKAIPGAQPQMDFARSKGFFTAPFPSEELQSLQGFPDKRVDLVQKALALVDPREGFSLAGGVHFALTDAIDPAKLPDAAHTVADDAPAFLVALDTLQKTPALVSFSADGGKFGAPNLLSIVPVQGFPLRPKTQYAAVVRRALTPGMSLTMARIADGDGPASYVAAYRKLALKDISGMAVFTTGDPVAQLAKFRDAALARPLPAPETPLALHETFDDYCVYGSTLQMPDWQSGTPPYTSSGGGWREDASGAPIFQRTEQANLWVTIPRAPMPAGGYPTAIFVRTGGGGDRPLVDRGPQAEEGGPALEPGTGPALWFAKAGWAGVQVDGPLGGLRNTTHGDEQFLVFNVQNPEALRDNIRESALELIVLAHALQGFDVSDCSGAPARLDPGTLAIMGHSMGATIAPLAVALEPMFKALVLSGAGGSWIENVLWKRKPVEVRPLAELLLGETLERGDPVLTLVQWAAEAGDPQVYARLVAPRHVLMLQGIVDNYILPNIANSLSIPLGLSLGGDEIDSVDGQTPLSTWLPLAGLPQVALPAAGNFVVQNPGDSIEDGHEVVFQTEPPKRQYRCFLSGLLTGEPRVPRPGAADAPCE